MAARAAAFQSVTLATECPKTPPRAPARNRRSHGGEDILSFNGPRVLMAREREGPLQAVWDPSRDSRLDISGDRGPCAISCRS